MDRVFVYCYFYGPFLVLCSFIFIFIFIFSLLCLIYSLSYALVVFIGVCTQWDAHPSKEHCSTWGAEDFFCKAVNVGFCFVFEFEFYLVWCTYPAGMTDNKCGINQSIKPTKFSCYHQPKFEL
jgi:hypothetical protein